jgi:hypothetical protein
MTPYRTPTLAGYALGSVRHALTVPVDNAGAIGAAAAATLGWAFGSANLALLWVVGLAMLMDLVVGAMRVVVDPLQEFSVAKLYGGLLGKLFRSLLIPAASLADWLYIASPLPLPDGYEQAFPVTAFVMFGLAAAEITSTFNKFRDSGVSPGLISVVIRHLDRIRTGMEPPIRRHYDPAAIAEEQERGEGAP